MSGSRSTTGKVEVQLDAGSTMVWSFIPKVTREDYEAAEKRLSESAKTVAIETTDGGRHTFLKDKVIQMKWTPDPGEGS